MVGRITAVRCGLDTLGLTTMAVRSGRPVWLVGRIERGVRCSLDTLGLTTTLGCSSHGRRGQCQGPGRTGPSVESSRSGVRGGARRGSALAGAEAAVDHEACADDEARLVRGEVDR